VEAIIARVWSEILGVKTIGVHDNFFDLGGHSLKATQVVSRLRAELRSEIPLRHLFEFTTIAELAAVIDSKTIRQLNGDKLDRLMSEIEAMSEEEARQLVDEKSPGYAKA
jgi:acyl carrier protein